MASTRQSAFVSFGMCVPDEIHLPNGRVLEEIVGGSGIYSTFSARIAATEERAEEIACCILTGYDFPDQVEERLTKWGIALQVERLADQFKTRGRLQYLDPAITEKTFRYLAGPLQPMPKDLPASFISASAFDILASPGLLKLQVEQLIEARRKEAINERPMIVWEPAPLTYKAEHYTEHLQTSQLVDVFSPKHVELLALCNMPIDGPFDIDAIESCATSWIEASQSGKLPRVCVVRAGEHGAMVIQRDVSGPRNEDLFLEWVPASYSATEAEKAVDATGGGNTFLGAFAIASQKNHGDAVDAAKRPVFAVASPWRVTGFRTRSYGMTIWSPTHG